ATISLTGFSGETIWPMGQLRLLVTIGDADHFTRAWMNFMIVRSLSPYNGITGRHEIKEIKAVPSTAHIMLKFPTDKGIVTIRSTILIPVEYATMIKLSKEIPKELNISSIFEKDIRSFDKRKRGRPQNARNPFKCFLDAYKGYHQIHMVESDEEKMAFHTGQGVYCYTKMPFGLKNAGATYQRLVDKAFDSQTSEAEQAFKQLKQHLLELPLLVVPKPKEELIVYLSASHEAINAVLITERGMAQMTVYFISRPLQSPELNYTSMEKLVLLLVFAAKRLRRTSVKGQILADFLIEKPGENPPDTSVVETSQEPWILFTNGSSCVDGSGAGLILTSLEGTEFTYALRFYFTASNNEAEYEALIAGLGIAAQMEVRNVHVSVDSIKEASKLRIKARQYKLLERVLYRRSFLKPWLRCLGPFQANYVIREIHEGSCSMHAGPWSIVAKAMRVAKIRWIKKEDIPKAIKIALEELKCVAFPSKNFAEHRLNVREGYLHVRQKKKGQALGRNKAIGEEVKKLVEADIVKEVHYHSWLSNPVTLKKHDDSSRMCVDFKDLNKACPKDGYPLSKIDWKVESLCGYPYKCVLDAYKDTIK
nr:reverse transcriptase domain-containing protein [Tanacetum cinerariifolium]